ncbi:MAG: hypothetical protein ABI649_01320 [Gaiellaceae bacterium]
MSALAAAILLGAEKSPAEEGRDVVLVMLGVGLIFVGVILLGQLSRYVTHKRQARRAAHRAH